MTRFEFKIAMVLGRDVKGHKKGERVIVDMAQCRLFNWMPSARSRPVLAFGLNYHIFEPKGLGWLPEDAFTNHRKERH